MTFILILSILALNLSPLETVPVNTQKSTIEWEGGSATTTHNGLISLKSGNLEISDGKLTGGTFEVDMTSITNLDVSEAYRGKLENHLKSEDFFDADAFPTAQLIIVKATEEKENLYRIIADFTVRDITKSIEFDATLTPSGNSYKASANFTFDRSEYEVKHRSGSFFMDLGDKLIYDEIKVAISVITQN
jgi:polyisoprenoid-binding protein YceI